MPSIGFATLSIIPEMQGTTADLARILTGSMDEAGRDAGRAAGRAIAAGINDSQADIRRAADQSTRSTGAAARGQDEMTGAQRRSTEAARESEDAQRRAAASTDEGTSANDRNAKSSLISKDNMLAFGAVAISAAGAIGAALISIASTFDDVEDTIRAGTGATGEALDGLVDSAKNVGTQVPAAFEDIAPVLSDLNKRLGLTGPVLEKLTGQFLEVSNMTGETLDADKITASFAAFGVTGEQTTEVMDRLWNVSQKTGLGLNDLTAAALKGAPQLKQFGFTLDESAALVGMLDKSGVDAEKTIAAMGKSMVAFAKDGKDPQTALFDTTRQLEDFIASGNDVAALNLAGELFGTKGAPQFIEAIKTGALSVDDLQHAIGASGDTILGAGQDTHDFAEQWLLFKNDVLVQLEPVATRVFGAITTAMTWIKENAIPTLQSWGEWISQNSGMLTQLGIVIGVTALALGGLAAAQAVIAAGGLVAWIKAATASTWLFNSALFANPIGIVVLALAALAAAVVVAYNKSETFREIIQAVWSGIQTAISWVWENVLKPIFEAFVAYYTTLGDAAMWLWHNIIEPVFSGIASAISGGWSAISVTFDLLKQGFGAVGDFFGDVGDTVGKVWDGIVSVIAKGVKAVGQLLQKVQIPDWVPGIGGKGLTGLGDSMVQWADAHMATGGLFRGRGTTTSDSNLVALSDQEFVVNARSARENMPILEAINAGGNIQRLAGGGVVGDDPELGGGTVNASIWEIIKGQFPDATLNSGYRAGDPGYHGIKKAIDVGGPMQEIADFMFSDYRDQLGQIIWNNGPVWYNVKKNELGTGVATAEGAEARAIYTEGQMAAHADHAHIMAEDVVRPKGADAKPPAGDLATATTPDASTTSTMDSAASAGSDAASGGGDKTRMKSFRELGSELGGILADGVVETFGIPSWIADPNELMGDDGSSVRTSADSGSGSGSSSTKSDADGGPVPAPARNGLTGSDLYSYDITQVAKEMGLSEVAAQIGNAVGLVETEMKMYANSNVPESLSFPHDAVGSDHDSVGVQQQRASWGSVADRMNSQISSKLFYDALVKVPGWETMDPGAAAQAVQRSAFPDKYGARMSEAAGLVKKAGLFDTGGMLMPGQFAFSLLDKPEPLLPADKWDIAERNIAAADKLVAAGKQQGPRGGDTFIGYGYTSRELADEWQRRQWARTGGYGGRSW